MRKYRMFKKMISLVLVVAYSVVTFGTLTVNANSGHYTTIASEYRMAYHFSEGLAPVMTGWASGASWGYIDTSGNVVIPIQNRFMDARPFSEGLAAVQLRQTQLWGFIDRTGNVVIPFQFQDVRAFHEGMAAVSNRNPRQGSGEWGFIDKTGNIVVPLIYGAVGNFSHGKAQVVRRSSDNDFWGESGFVDVSGNLVIPFNFVGSTSHFSDGLARVLLEGHEVFRGNSGYIDIHGNLVLSGFSSSGTFSEGLALVSREGRTEFINTTGTAVIPPVLGLNFYGDFSDGLAIVRDVGGRFGYIDTSGNVVISPTFDYAYDFNEGVAIVQRGGQHFLIGKDGTPIFQINDFFGAVMGYAPNLFEGILLVPTIRNGDVRFEFRKLTDAGLAAINPIRVYLDGQRLSFDSSPQMINGRTMLPLRAIFEEMGAEVEWNPQTQTATAIRGDTTVILTVGSLSPTVDGVVVPIDQAGIIIDGRTLAPLRFVAEAFGGTVEWDNATRIATITTN